jgi:hypothetical protein
MDALDAEALLRNCISGGLNGIYSCGLCRRPCIYAHQVQNHVQGYHHQRRLSNKKFQEDPLLGIPHPHSDFVDIVGGWPKCTICDKFFDSDHMNSPNHIWYLNQKLQVRIMSSMSVQPPLPQPPPPPDDLSSGCSVHSIQVPPVAASVLSMSSDAQLFAAVGLNGARPSDSSTLSHSVILDPCSLDPWQPPQSVNLTSPTDQSIVGCVSAVGHISIPVPSPPAMSSVPSKSSGAQTCGAVSNALPDDGSQSLMSDSLQMDPWEFLPSQLTVPPLSYVSGPRLSSQPPPPTDLSSFCCADAVGHMPTAFQTAPVASSVLSMPSGAQTFCRVPRPSVQGYLESASILSDPWQPSPLQLTASLLLPVESPPPFPLPISTPDECSVDCDESSAAGTSVDVVTSGQQMASDDFRHLVHAYSFPASTQSECFISVPCEASASHSMSPPFEQVASMSASLHASEIQVEPQHVLKPRGSSGLSPCVDGCNQRLNQSEISIDTQWRFFDV